MTDNHQPSLDHILIERASASEAREGNTAGSLPSLPLPISAFIDGAQNGYSSFPIEAQTHGPAQMLVNQTRLRVTRAPDMKHPSPNRCINQEQPACGDLLRQRHVLSSCEDINFVRPSPYQVSRYPPKKSALSGDSIEQNNYYPELSPSSRVALYHLPPIQVGISNLAKNSSNIEWLTEHSSALTAASDVKQQQKKHLYHSNSRILAEPITRSGGYQHHHQHHMSSSGNLVQLSTNTHSFSCEAHRSMSDYLLHRVSDQRREQLASSRVTKSDLTADNFWKKPWERRKSFPLQADKSPAIIIDARTGEDDPLDKKKKPIPEMEYTSAPVSDTNADAAAAAAGPSHQRCHHQSPMGSPKHLVSPHAIQKAEQEEQEEAKGKHPDHPFLTFPSFKFLKQLDEDQIKAYYHRNSRSVSPPSHISTPASTKSPNYTTEFPSPSSSIIFSPVSGQLSYYMHHEQPSLSDSHRSHDAHPPSLVLETSPQDKSSQQQPQTKTRERLKRPPNAYLLFNRDMRRKLLEISPKMTVAEISKEIGERWKELSKDQRQSYIDQAALIKQDHLQTHPNFIYTRRSKAEIAEARNLSKSRRCMKSTVKANSPWAAFTDCPAGTVAADQTTHCRRRRQQDAKDITRDPRGRKKKRHKHPTAPKHPMSGFLFYLSAVRPQIAQRFPGSTVGPISKIIARQWRNMSNQERIPWLEKAEQDKARYAQEMQIYMGTLGEQREDASQAAVQVIDAPGHFQEPQ